MHVILGIVQKGDGKSIHLRSAPWVVETLIGGNEPRTLYCKNCVGEAKSNRLLAPVALTAGPDNSLYIGDFNLIRKITPTGNVFTILELR